MIAMPNSHLVLHIETSKQHFENKISIKHLIKIIHLGAKNCPVGRNGLIATLAIYCGIVWVRKKVPIYSSTRYVAPWREGHSSYALFHSNWNSPN